MAGREKRNTRKEFVYHSQNNSDSLKSVMQCDKNKGLQGTKSICCLLKLFDFIFIPLPALDPLTAMLTLKYSNHPCNDLPDTYMPHSLTSFRSLLKYDFIKEVYSQDPTWNDPPLSTVQVFIPLVCFILLYYHMTCWSFIEA